jgi:hypothetical protein
MSAAPRGLAAIIGNMNALLRSLVSVCGLVLAAGCMNRLQVSRINSAESKPNNVWVFFTVEKGEEPIGGLTANDFGIYEDDQLVSEFESKQTIQNPDVAAVMYTMLLLDVSGSITESGQSDALVDAAEAFSERVGKSQKVGVYAFDGEEKLHSVVPFTEAKGSLQGGLNGLRSYKAKDPSTNLHGAVVAALAELQEELAKDSRPLKFGTLVVFSDGTDRAARVSREEMLDEMRKEQYEHYEMFAIGLGAEMEQSSLAEVGRDGTELATDSAKVQQSFDRVAQRIEAHMKRFYLLSYCTPARKGSHQVRIVAKTKEDEKGALEYTFNADGFGPPPACDPERKPTFDLKDTTVKPEEEPVAASKRRH